MSSNACVIPLGPAKNSRNGDSGISKSSNHNAMSPAFVLTNHREHLTNYECSEILQYRSVYYFAPKVTKVDGSLTRSNNFGFDTERGNYRCLLNDQIHYRYQIVAELGQGTFGDVVKAYDHKYNAYVAIKITRNEPRLAKQAQAEARLLEYIRSKDPSHSSNTVEICNSFVFRNHICLVFELLEEDLFCALKSRNFQGLDILDIQSIVRDILTCLQYLSDISIVHCDLKPENIVFRDTSSIHVKIIDFGSSSYGKESLHGDVQSLYYRAPEVILANGFHSAIDMWSLGCLVVEMYTGSPLFPGRTVEEQLVLQMETLGLPPAHMISSGAKSDKFFDQNGQPIITDLPFIPASVPLSDLLGFEPPKELLNFIESCLAWDPKLRLTPQQALQHPFISKSFASPQIPALAVPELITFDVAAAERLETNTLSSSPDSACCQSMASPSVTSPSIVSLEPVTLAVNRRETTV